VWALLVEKRALDFTLPSGKPFRLRHGGYPTLEGKEAPWKRSTTRVEGLNIDHTILLDKRFIDPTYDRDTGFTFVFEGENMAQKVGEHVGQAVDIAVFPDWHAGLLKLGQREGLVRRLINHGHTVWQVSLERTRWTTLIAAAVEQGELTWLNEEPSEAAKRLLSEPITEEEPEQPATTDVISDPPDYSLEHDGDWTWLHFNAKPDVLTRERLKQNGFRWGKRRKAWYTRQVIKNGEVAEILQIS